MMLFKEMIRGVAVYPPILRQEGKVLFSIKLTHLLFKECVCICPCSTAIEANYLALYKRKEEEIILP